MIRKIFGWLATATFAVMWAYEGNAIIANIFVAAGFVILSLPNEQEARQSKEVEK